MFRRSIVLLLAAVAACAALPYDHAQAGKPPAKIYELHWVASQLGFPDTNAGAINDAGDVVGVAWWTDGAIEAFRYSNELMENLNDVAQMPLTHPGWRLLGATGINNHGQIAGSAEYRVFTGTYDKYGNPIYIQDFGVYRYVEATGVEILSALTTGGVYQFEADVYINDSGVMVGIGEVIATKRRFAYKYTSDKQLVELPGPANGIGVWKPYAINAGGWITGCGLIDGVNTALRYNPLTNTTESLGWLRTRGSDPHGVGYDINADREVAGEVTTKGLAVVHAFLHDPTSEGCSSDVVRIAHTGIEFLHTCGRRICDHRFCQR